MATATTFTDDRYSGASSAYLKELRNYPPVGERELHRLIRRARAGDRQSFNRAVEANLRFVASVALEFHNKWALPLDEMLAEGNRGLVRAVELYDPDRGYRFSTYAVWWIRQGLLRLVRGQGLLVRLPTNRLDDRDRMRRAASRLTQRLGREPTPEELTSALQFTTNRLRAADETAPQTVSLDAQVSDGSGDTFHDLHGDAGPSAVAGILREEARRNLRDAMEVLDGRDAEILSLTFGLDGDPLSLTEVGRRMGVSKERIRQLRNRAIARLREQLGHLDLDTGDP